MIEVTLADTEGALVGVDVGGTFTDAVAVAAGRMVTAEVPTTPDDQSEGVIAAVGAALERAGIGPDAVRRLCQGMTVGTNALLEGRGPAPAWWPPRASATCSSCGARPRRTATGSTPATLPRRCRTSAPTRSASAAGPTAC